MRIWSGSFRIAEHRISSLSLSMQQGMPHTCRSSLYIVEFVQALGKWVDESLMARIRQWNFYSIMADECTDVSTLEELSIYCRWVENGLPVEHFIDILPIKKANVGTITGALIACLKNKQIPITRLIGMGFDGAAAFSGKKWCTGSSENAISSCLVRILSLSSLAVGLRSSG